MEQVFVIIAVVVFWIFKGVAGTQRRVPGQDPHDSEPPGGPIDISGAARQKTLESQQRAMEALQRWEAKQGLSGGKGDPAHAASAEAVPAAARTRVGRPATTRSRSAARQRKEAFAEIARVLDPAQASSGTPARRPSFEVSTPASSPPDREAPRPVSDRRPSDAATRRAAAHKDEESRREIAAEQSSAATKAQKERAAKASGLARLESLPLSARAIVYAEILGRPPSLS
ncbi:MAG: hypothetical protein N2B05_04760 [Gemmatimonadales bacterium]